MKKQLVILLLLHLLIAKGVWHHSEDWFWGLIYLFFASQSVLLEMKMTELIKLFVLLLKEEDK